MRPTSLALGFCRIGKLQHPEQILLTAVSVNDLALYKEAWSEIENQTFFEDKVFMSDSFLSTCPKNSTLKC